MTTVAWDGETLAADSQSTTGSIRGTAAKSSKSADGFLVAGAGTFAVVKVWVAWVLAGRPAESQPTSAEDATIIVVDPRGRAVMFAETPVAQPLPRKRWAIGSGSDLALGAMAMGADARQAVKVAAKFDVYTGGRIVVLRPGK